MALTPFVLLHVLAATVSLVAGYLAMLLRKGSAAHRIAGVVFAGSMFVMCIAALYVALFERPSMLNAVVACLTSYLVLTAWRAARGREGVLGGVDRAACLFIAVVSLLALGAAITASARPEKAFYGSRPSGLFVFGSIALVCCIRDLRILRQGVLAGAARLRRHLWRMGLALLIASLALYPGQGRLFPQELRDSNVLLAPSLLLVTSMLVWMVRTRRRSTTNRDDSPVPRRVAGTQGTTASA